MYDFQKAYCIDAPTASGMRLSLAPLKVSPLISLGLGISTAAAIWSVTAHGAGIIQAVGNLLSFVYGIGLLM
jgi:hypothetical protein